MLNYEIKRKILEKSIKYNLGHIPSSFSMLDYYKIFNSLLNNYNYKLFMGKFFGAQSYYAIWDEEIKQSCLNYNDSHCFYVDISLGNILGIMIGYALVNKNIKVIGHISDSILQSGIFLECISLAADLKLDNIYLILDNNNKGIYTSLNINPHHIFINWKLYTLNSNNPTLCFTDFIEDIKSKPKIMICHTKKGDGINFLEKNPEKYHYKIPTEKWLDKLYEEN